MRLPPMKVREKEASHPLFTYGTNDYVACRSCGAFSRIQYVPPIPIESRLMKSHFCPHCGVAYEFNLRYPNGGPYLMGDVMLDREVTIDEAEQLQQIYMMWNATVYPTFKGFLQSLRDTS